MTETHPLDLKFYTKCAKPLILQLSTPKERSLASAWLKWLTEDKSSTESLKTNYLKLLIQSLHTKKLRRPFLAHPKSFETLPEFPQALSVADSRQERRPQPVTIDFSGDLRTYVAYQEIEDLGVHCYYAFSKNPFPTWYSFDPYVLPMAGKPAAAGLEAAGLRDDGSDHLKVLDKALEGKKQDFVQKLEKKIKSEKKKAPMQPLGKAVEPEEDGLSPSWGSNLLRVQDPSENISQ